MRGRAGAVVAVAVPLIGALLLVHEEIGTAPPAVPAPAPVAAGPASAVAAVSAAASASTAASASAALPPPQALPRSRPVELLAPQVGRVTGLVELGLQADGSLEVPSGAERAGWWAGGAAPGEAGPAVLVGHVTWGGRPAVFHALGRLRPGQLVQVTRADGRAVAFRVRSVESHRKDIFPTERVYAPTARPELRLVTCGGRWDGRRYADNIVVFAELAEDGTQDRHAEGR